MVNEKEVVDGFTLVSRLREPYVVDGTKFQFRLPEVDACRNIGIHPDIGGRRFSVAIKRVAVSFGEFLPAV